MVQCGAGGRAAVSVSEAFGQYVHRSQQSSSKKSRWDCTAAVPVSCKRYRP